MVKIEELDTYRKMKLWINELPEDVAINTDDTVISYDANNDVHWYNGIICLELRIAPIAASNYAMLCLRFKEDTTSKFCVSYNFEESDETVSSDIAMKNDIVKKGIVKEYNSTLIHVFDGLSQQNLFPSGKMEILGGRYGSIGSSSIAVQKVLKILLKLYKLNDELLYSDLNPIILDGCKRV